MTEQEKAELRLKAANLRILAASQTANASAHRRQAEHPAYSGQEDICYRKADTIDAFAARSIAEAELLEARIL